MELLNLIRKRRPSRCIASLVLVTFSTLVLQPASPLLAANPAAVDSDARNPQRVSQVPASPHPATAPFAFTSAAGAPELPIRAVQAHARDPITDSASLRAMLNPSQPSPRTVAESAKRLHRRAASTETFASEAIRALVATLEGNPLEIYRWVHDSIEFVPNYGAVQGAAMTYATRRGNAYDTASLLIVLLRAAGIQARYVYGTVEVPIARLMNWVGGVTAPGAALQLLGQGGIPNEAVVRGGRIVAGRMEHIWVEAWVDFFPSRGARHRVGDTWVPMDASFKQYAYTQGLDRQEFPDLDWNSIVAGATAAAEHDADQGWIRGIDHHAIERAAATWASAAQRHVENSLDTPTLGDLAGRKIITVTRQALLAGSLPYAVVLRGDSFEELPEQLRHRFTYTLYRDGGGGNTGARVLHYEARLAELAHSKLTLSFVPATESDRDTLLATLPELGPGTSIDDLPDSVRFPGHQIELKARLQRDGVSLAEGVELVMGQHLVSEIALWDPASGWTRTRNRPIAGEHAAIVVAPMGVSPWLARTLAERMQRYVAIAEGTGFDPEQGDDPTGDLLYAMGIDYYRLSTVSALAGSRTAGIVQYQKPSVGVFKVAAQVEEYYGVPRSVSFPGVSVDIDIYQTMGVARNGNRDVWLDYMLGHGIQLSALEHIVPERMFRPLDNTLEGASAVKALMHAGAQGQRVYRIDSDNLATALPAIEATPLVHEQIEAAVTAGQLAVVHERPVAIGGWSGTGFILFDPETGSGAYRISDGTNGGGLWFLVAAIAAIMILAPLVQGVAASYLVITHFGTLLFGATTLILAIQFGVNIEHAKKYVGRFLSIALAFWLLPGIKSITLRDGAQWFAWLVGLAIEVDNELREDQEE